MSKLAPQTETFEEDAFTRQQIMDKLTHWWSHLDEINRGVTNCTLTRSWVLVEMDRWLDELAQVAEIRWVPTVEEEMKLAMGWRN